MRLPPSLTIRALIDLSPEGIRRFEAEHEAEQERLGRLARLSRSLPLVGMLPAHRLQRLREEVGLDPRRAVVAWPCRSSRCRRQSPSTATS